MCPQVLTRALSLLLAMHFLVMVGNADFNIVISPSDKVDVGKTKNVELKCSYDDKNIKCNNFTKIYQLALYKVNKDKNDRIFMERAFRDDRVLIRTYGKLTVRARMGGSYLQTYVTATWATAVDSTLGSYRCGVAGYDEDIGATLQWTKSLTIAKAPRKKKKTHSGLPPGWHFSSSITISFG